ncbi:MAG: hypothetical protein ABR518_07455 [Actinomycetota bacterium]
MARTPLALVAPLLLLAAGCGAPTAEPSDAPQPTLIISPYSTVGPVVIVAIDNHFHDIHPTDRRVISAAQPVTVRNDGRYRHNFTVVGTKVSVYLEPGDRVSWPRIGDVVSPGFHPVICKIHQNVGMGGEFTIAPAT